MSNYDLLSLEEIKKLSSIILEGYSNGSYIPISKFLEIPPTEGVKGQVKFLDVG